MDAEVGADGFENEMLAMHLVPVLLLAPENKLCKHTREGKNDAEDGCSGSS